MTIEGYAIVGSQRPKYAKLKMRGVPLATAQPAPLSHTLWKDVSYIQTITDLKVANYSDDAVLDNRPAALREAEKVAAERGSIVWSAPTSRAVEINNPNRPNAIGVVKQLSLPIERLDWRAAFFERWIDGGDHPVMRWTDDEAGDCPVYEGRRLYVRQPGVGTYSPIWYRRRKWCEGDPEGPNSPRLCAKSLRTRVSPSIVSVLARRRRREVKIDAGSTTWLSMPSLSSTRWIQKPSSPASWMTIIGKSAPVRVRAFCLSSEKRCRSFATSPLGRECLDIVSPAPGAREVITQVERDSSIETKIAARSVRIAASSGRDLTSCIFASRMGSAPHSGERSGRYPLPMGSRRGDGLFPCQCIRPRARAANRPSFRADMALVAHAARPHQRMSEDALQLGLAPDLAHDVARDPAEIGAERLQRPVGALELLGVSVALVGDERMFADPFIGLAQIDARCPACVPIAASGHSNS